MPRVCLCCGSANEPMFKFPIQNQAHLRKWQKNLAPIYNVKNVTENDLICAKHFRSSSIAYGKKSIKLKKNAVPLCDPREFPRKSNKRRKLENFGRKDTSEEASENGSITNSMLNEESLNDTNSFIRKDDSLLDHITDKSKITNDTTVISDESDAETTENERINTIVNNKMVFQKSQIPMKLSADDHLSAKVLTVTDVAFARETRKTRLHCTACDIHLGTAPVAQFDRFIHPVLNTLLCKNCFHFFSTGIFTKDDDGSEIYCKWCSQGGTVMCCSACELVFCKDCVQRNLGPTVLKEIENADVWNCFRCNPSQLSRLQIMAAALHIFTLKKIGDALACGKEEILRKDLSLCCTSYKEDSEDEEYSPPSKKKKVSTSALSSSEQKKSSIMQPTGVALLNKALNKLPNMPSPHSATNMSTPPPMIKIRAIPTALLQDPKLDSLEPPKLVPQAPTPTHVYKRTFSMPNNINNKHNIKIVPKLSVKSHVTSDQKSPPRYTSSPPPLTPTLAGIKTFGPANKRLNTTAKYMNARDWLKTAIETSTIEVKNLLTKYAEIDSESQAPLTPSQLAHMHNKMQHIMSHCTNVLIETRKRMHREFLGYLAKINVSHSSVGRPAFKPITATSIAVPQTVPAPVVSKPVYKPTPALAVSTPSGMKVINQMPLVIRGNAPVAIRGLRPVALNSLPPGVRLQKAPIVVPIAKPRLRMIPPLVQPKSGAMPPAGVRNVVQNPISSNPPVQSAPKKIIMSAPVSLAKDPLAISDDEDENSVLEMLQPEVILKQGPPKLKDSNVKIKIEDDS